MSAGAGPYPSFQTNVNRQKTKRWVEAKSFSYDGDEWGYDDDDDDNNDGYDEPESHAPPSVTESGPGGRPYPPPGPPGVHRPGDGPPPRSGPPPNRNVANMGNMGNSHMNSRGRPSFDDRRPFPPHQGPPHQGSFEGPYPSAQRPPFANPENCRKSPSQDRNMRPRGASQSNPMGFDPHPHAPFMPDPRSGGPYPMRPSDRRSESGRRPSPGEIYGRQSPARQSPVPSSSQNSRDSSPGHKFPPRKSSLSQQQAPFEPSTLTETVTSAESPVKTPPDDNNEESTAKPLPFIRPADIYKRMEQERQRRASQESSRPSLDSEGIRSNSPPPSLPPISGVDQSDISERTLRPKPTLDPVTERKSEYGFDKMLEHAPEGHPSAGEPQPAAEPSSTITRSQTMASSQYSDRPDPISASSVQSNHSFTPGRSDAERFKDDQPTPRQTYGFSQNDSKIEPSKSESQLKHNQSFGYRSLVHRAFDDSQDQVPPTPQSLDDSVPRSNSASTSQISPIISRNSSTGGQAPASSGPTEAPPTIPEEPSSRPTSSDMAKGPRTEDEPLNPPPTVQPGYRRDTNTPNPNNSPARRPVSGEVNDVPQSELATVSTVTPVQTEPGGQWKAQPMSTREENTQLKEWSIPRSESPTKGKVRDLAGKFGTPGRSSPSSSPQKESPRPPPARNESFRPVLPGGWMSYTTNTGISTPAETPAATENAAPNTAPAPPSNQPTDSLPTAIAPKQIKNDALSGSAFAAAAAAGSALADAFSTIVEQPSGTARSEPRRESPPVSHDGKLLTETSSRNLQPAATDTAAVSVASSKPPTPPPKDFSESNSASTMTDYFPTPLLPKKAGGNEATPFRPQMLPTLSTDTSPQDSESDRLRKEILKDLTPRSARAESSKDPRSELTATPKPRDQVESTLIPEEYNTYWNDVGQSPDLSLSKPGTENRQSVGGPKDLPPPPPPQEQPAAPRTVKKRFSWESWSDDEPFPAVQPLSTPTTRDFQQQEILSPMEVTKPNDQNPETPYSSSYRTPSLVNDDEMATPESPIYEAPLNEPHLDHRISSTPSSPIEEPAEIHGSETVDSAEPPANPIPEPIPKQVPDLPKIPQDLSSQEPLAFREIMALKTPQDRVLAFNNARQHFIQADSGLAGWLQSTGDMLPEHADVMNSNGRSKQHASFLGHKASPSRSKFPRIASLGGVVQPSQDNAQSAHPQRDISDSYGSKLSSHQMQEEGKKLLQSAGKFGGKAGGAAKGLLMKGKNRLRQSGGEKARSKSSQFEDTQNAPHSSPHAAPSTYATADLDDQSKFSSSLHQPNLLTDQYIQHSQPQGSLQEKSSYGTPQHELPQREPPRLEVSQSDAPESGGFQQEASHLEEPQPKEPGLLMTNDPNEATRPVDEVSAVGSQDEGNIPSRSISEVTGPRYSKDDTRLVEQTAKRESKSSTSGQDVIEYASPPGHQHETLTREDKTDPESTLRAPKEQISDDVPAAQFVNSNNYSVQHGHRGSREVKASYIRPSEPYHREDTSISPPTEQTALPNRRQRQSYSRPFKEADVNDHPAFRCSPEDIERRSQVYATEEFADNSQPGSAFLPKSPTQTQESVYRIPGPYGQQYRSPRQPARPPQQFSPSHDHDYDMSSEIRRSTRFDEYGNPISYNSNGRIRPPSQERPFIPRPNATEYAIPGVGPPLPPAESPPKSRPRSGIFGRARSRSRPPTVPDDTSDTIENLFSEDTRKKERRASLFGRRTSKQTVPIQPQFDAGPPRDLQHSSTLPPNFSFEDNTKKPKKLKRASTSEATKKTGFGRLSGIFSRSKSTNQPPQSVPERTDSNSQASYRQTSIRSPPAPPQHVYHPAHSNNNYNPSMNGSARDKPTEVRQNSLQNNSRFDIENYRSSPPSSPPNLRIDTASSKHRPVQASSPAAILSQQSAPTRSSPYETTSPTATSPYGYGSARGLNSSSLSHAIDLHKRSRSPRGGRRNSEEDVNISTDPAYRLGRFDSPKERNKGEQEKPWTIGLPTERKPNDGNHVRPPRTSSLAATGTPSIHTRPQNFHQQVQPAELRGSRVDGDESEEEIVMSSTAYPGQEWIPHSFD